MDGAFLVSRGKRHKKPGFMFIRIGKEKMDISRHVVICPEDTLFFDL